MKLVKKFYGWPEDAKFLVPDGVLENFREGIGKRGRKLSCAMERTVREVLKRNIPNLAEQLDAHAEASTAGWLGQRICQRFPPTRKALATRESSGKVLNALAENIPWLIGGSADLASFDQDATRNLMARAISGQPLRRSQPALRGSRTRHGRERQRHCALRIARLRSHLLQFQRLHAARIRLAALMEVPVIFIFTHDSIGRRRGRTDAPADRAAAPLRAMPKLIVRCVRRMRTKSTEAWKVIMQLKHEPGGAGASPSGDADLRPHEVWCGGGCCERRLHSGRCRRRKAGSHSDGDRAAKLSLCVEAFEKLKAEGVRARVVSMPSWESLKSKTTLTKRGSSLHR